jgi:hypothetical protein
MFINVTDTFVACRDTMCLGLCGVLCSTLVKQNSSTTYCMHTLAYNPAAITNQVNAGYQKVTSRREDFSNLWV